MRFALIGLIMLFSTSSPLLTRCYGEPTTIEWNKDERLVLQNVAAGKITQFDEKTRGILRHEFLEALLTGSLKESKEAKYILVVYARVIGKLDLSYQDVKPYVSFKSVIFEDKVDFSWSSFAKGLNLSFGEFKNDIAFRGMETQGPFRCIDTTFSGEDCDIRSLRAQHVVDFEGATFQPIANFAYCRVGSIFYCNKAVFHKRARFDHMRIDGDASFLGAQFDGPVQFKNTLVGGDFILDGTCFNLEEVAPGGYIIDMSYLDIKGIFQFIEPKNWPQRGIRQTGIKYASWAPPNLDPLELVKGTDFDPQVYTNLEHILRSTGQTEKANNVGIARKQAERSNLKYKDASYWWSLLLYIFVGNGYHPEWALMWSIFIVALGAIFFQKHCMIVREDKTEKHREVSDQDRVKKYRYSPIWYSLDLFVPAINLETADIWMPARDQRFLLFWMRIQRILGWLIVPIGLVALTGIVQP